MNKLATFAVALLLLALVSLPWVVGAMTEARVRERVAEIDSSPEASAELTAFDRGWFRSAAKITLKLVPDNVAAADDYASSPLGAFSLLPIAVDFAHGPIAVLDGVHFGWSKLVARPDTEAPGIGELQRTLDVPYVFEFRGRTSYFGKVTFDADAPPFVLPVDEALLTFSGATLAGTFANGRLDADAQLTSVEFRAPTGTFAVSGVSATMDNELRSRYLMPGEAALSIASISISEGTQAAAPMFEAADLRVSSDVGLDAAGELVDMRVSYDLDSMRIQENEITAGAVGIAIRNLDVDAIEAYGGLAADAAVAGAEPAALFAALGPHLERALKAGPSVTLDPLRFRFDDEPFEGRIEITTNAARLPPAGTLTLDNPLLLLGLFNTDANVRASKPLTQQLVTLAARLQLGSDPLVPPDQLDYMAEAQSGLMLTMLVGQGVLVEDGDGYRTSLQLNDGALTLNGNPLPFGL